MKRDMDFVRSILLAVETAEQPNQPIVIVGRSPIEIGYRVEIMHEARLLEGTAARDPAGRPGYGGYRISRLTWKGHEFLEATRDPGTWQKVLARIGGPLGAATLDLVKDLAVEELKRRLGIGS
jgi:hypothetical protein